MQRGRRRLDSCAGRRRKGTTQRLLQNGRVRRGPPARSLRLVGDFDAAGPAISRNDRACRRALARFIFRQRRPSERQASRAERGSKAEPRHHRVRIKPGVAAVRIAVRRRAAVKRHAQQLHGSIQRSIVADRDVSRADARHYVFVGAFEFRSVVSTIPEFRRCENCFQHLANVSVRLPVPKRHTLHERLGRVVCHEVLRELIAQVPRGSRMTCQDIERVLTFPHPTTGDAVAQKYFVAKVVAVRVEVEAARVRPHLAVGLDHRGSR